MMTLGGARLNAYFRKSIRIDGDADLTHDLNKTSVIAYCYADKAGRICFFVYEKLDPRQPEVRYDTEPVTLHMEDVEKYPFQNELIDPDHIRPVTLKRLQSISRANLARDIELSGLSRNIYLDRYRSRYSLVKYEVFTDSTKDGKVDVYIRCRYHGMMLGYVLDDSEDGSLQKGDCLKVTVKGHGKDSYIQIDQIKKK